MTVPNVDEKKGEIKDDEDDAKREYHNLLCEGCFGDKYFGFTMIRSVMFLRCLEAAPALVGRWHVKESRLGRQLITNMVQT